ncbi:MAG: 16S rRNA (cytidine(1402)-2'-O)-methyltransferase [Prevotellaceae bacterium]|jgi:16S rRNA (cytidine1402-2'-O)-methyltransferase|nr:16S rRNA (cytidine(1402)-2'-O)-methyltransferase [Prevotellaceae bacterium]
MNKLYIVPTPVGNLEDITLRALRVLAEADIILAEDTRKTLILLKKHGLTARLMAYHKFNEHRIAGLMVEKMAAGARVALVSDAGTPGISDPGFLLVRTCIENGIEVECLPGATAFVPALINSGLPCDRFCFEGFLPPKKGRNARVEQLRNETRTMIFYEAPGRLLKALTLLAEVFGNDRRACVSREISKIYEENRRGTLADLVADYTNRTPKGEIVIVVAGNAAAKKHRRPINEKENDDTDG